MSLFNFFNKNKKQTPPVYHEPEEDDDLIEHNPLTLFTSTGAKAGIIPVFTEIFQKWGFVTALEGEFSASFDLPDGGEFSVKVLTDPIKIRNQISDIENFFLESPVESRNLKKAVANQISAFNCVIMTDIYSSKELYKDVQNAIFKCAKAIAAFVLTTDMCLFHNDGRLLINADGETEFSEFHPISNADTLYSPIEESPVDKARKDRTVALLKAMNIPYVTSDKCPALSSNVRLQKAESIVGRLAALFAVNIKAEVININDGFEHLDAMFNVLNEKYSIEDFLTPREKQFLKNPHPISSEVSEYGWMYEATATLMWVLSLLHLPGASTMCNVSQMSKVIWDNDFESLCARARILDINEILEYYDQIFRMHHSATEARNNDLIIENLHESILYFRHYALNWVLCVRGIGNWDDIKANT